MSKELEALERLFSNLDKYMGYYDEQDCHVENGGELDYDLVKKALTPPTADEVCKALSDYFGFNYYYQDEFFYKSDGNKYVYLLKVSGFTEIQLYDGHLPPRLVTLIGRFYEGLEDER